jgi:hypothetical protein
LIFHVLKLKRHLQRDRQLRRVGAGGGIVELGPDILAARFSFLRRFLSTRSWERLTAVSHWPRRGYQLGARMLNQSPYYEARAWSLAMERIGQELREMYDTPEELTRELRMLLEQMDRPTD